MANTLEEELLKRTLRKATSIGAPKGPLRALPHAGEAERTQPFVRAAELLDPLGNAAPGPAKALLPLGSAIRNPTYRQAVHEATRGDVERLFGEVNKPLVESFTRLQQKYPRLFAHIAKISPINVLEEGSTGGTSYPMSRSAASASSPMFGLRLSEATQPSEALTSVAHEAAHTGQGIQLYDRARRAGQLMEEPFEKQYMREIHRFGYHGSPMETRARIVGEMQRLKSQRPGLRKQIGGQELRKVATERGMSRSWTVAHPAVGDKEFAVALERAMNPPKVNAIGRLMGDQGPEMFNLNWPGHPRHKSTLTRETLEKIGLGHLFEPPVE